MSSFVLMPLTARYAAYHIIWSISYGAYHMVHMLNDFQKTIFNLKLKLGMNKREFDKCLPKFETRFFVKIYEQFLSISTHLTEAHTSLISF